jgi:hypothetical protein
MALILPTLRLYKTAILTLEVVETLNLGVTAFNDISAPAGATHEIHGLFALLNQFKGMPSGYDYDGNPIHTDFTNIVTITNTGEYTIKIIHDSALCQPENKIYLIPQTDHNLQPKYSLTFHYKQIPTRVGWWEFQTI